MSSARTQAGVIGLVSVLLAATVVAATVSATPSSAAAAELPAAQQLPGSVDDDAIQAITELLVERSRAVVENDIAARAATLADDASIDLVNVDLRTVTGAEAVGLSTYVELLYEPTIDLSPPGLELHEGRRAVTLEVTREMAIADFDDRLHVSTQFVTFVETASGWKVLADDTLRPIGLGSDREIWELYDTSIERRDRVLVIGTAGVQRHGILADLAEQALTRFDAAWPTSWQGSFVMIVPRSTTELEELLQPTIDVSKFVAFTTLAVDRRDGYEVVAPRIVAQETNLAARSPQRQVDILVHELAHVASVINSGPATPLWAHEGLAEWITAGRPASTGGDIELPDLHRFRTGSSSEIREVYDQAATTMEQIAGRFGELAPLDLFDAIGAARREPGTTDHVLDRALRELTGSTLAELTR